MQVRFKLEKETKGALRYQEVDERGEPIEPAWAKIGTLYIRKSAFERGTAWPRPIWAGPRTEQKLLSTECQLRRKPRNE